MPDGLYVFVLSWFDVSCGVFLVMAAFDLYTTRVIGTCAEVVCNQTTFYSSYFQAQALYLSLRTR